MIEIFMILYIINLVILAIAALVFYALFNMIFVDPLEELKKKATSKVKGFFNSLKSTPDSFISYVKVCAS